MSLQPVCGGGKAWLEEGKSLIEIHSYENYAFRYWLSNEWSVNVSAAHSAIQIPPHT